MMVLTQIIKTILRHTNDDEENKSTSEYRGEWEDDDLRELCEGLAEASGDDTYLKMLGVDVDLSEFQSD